VREPTAALLKVVVVRQAEEVPASTPWLARVSKRKPHRFCAQISRLAQFEVKTCSLSWPWSDGCEEQVCFLWISCAAARPP